MLPTIVIYHYCIVSTFGCSQLLFVLLALFPFSVLLAHWAVSMAVPISIFGCFSLVLSSKPGYCSTTCTLESFPLLYNKYIWLFLFPAPLSVFGCSPMLQSHIPLFRIAVPSVAFRCSPLLYHQSNLTTSHCCTTLHTWLLLTSVLYSTVF